MFNPLSTQRTTNKIMIQEIKMYTCCCDNCGVSVDEGSEYSCWGEKSDAEQVALDSDWIEDEKIGKIYCTDCASIDEDDNLIINESFKKA